MGRTKKLPPALLERLPPETEMGPAMKKLPSDGMRLFVVNVLEQGVKANWTEAYRAAGFAGDDSVCKVAGYRLAHDPRVQEAIREEARKRMSFAAIMGQAYLIEVMQNPNEDPRLRVKCATELMDRGGLHPLFEQKITHEVHMSREDKLREIARLAVANGKDPREVLGNLVDISAEDYKVVSDADDRRGP